MSDEVRTPAGHLVPKEYREEYELYLRSQTRPLRDSRVVERILRADCVAVIERISADAARIAELEAAQKASDETIQALERKYADCPHPKGEQYWGCACSYDKPLDVCDLHAPLLRDALAKIAELEAALREAQRLLSLGEFSEQVDLDGLQ